MTRVLTCGYETGDHNEANGGTNVLAQGSVSVVNSTPTPRAGSYCLKSTVLAPGNTPAQMVAYKAFTLPAPKTELWVRWAVYGHLGFAPISGDQVRIATIYDPSANATSSVWWEPSAVALRIIQGYLETHPLLATGTGFLADSWHVLEWRTQITDASNGTSELWLDGNRVINFSGDNTISTAGASIQAIGLGMLGWTSGLGAATGSYIGVDDIAVNDTSGTRNNGRAGDGRVIMLLPTGAGSSTQLARGGTDTGANYSQVNELPPSMAQYVTSATVGDRDLYAMQNLSVAVQSINVVEVTSLTQNSDAGAGRIAHTLKSGATTNEATPINLGTSAVYVTSRWETDPNTSAAWTASAIDALETGATIR